MEKTIRAFSLLEALTKSGCPFLFKGGSALMLQLACTQRLSVDIDIVCPPGTDIISYLEPYAEEYGFGRFDANGRDHSKTTYLKRKWRSFRYQSSRLFKLFSLFPRYISGYAWGWFCGAVGRVVRGR